ncbi:hypothetical protein F3Y22_tig00112226pilonHSYRG00037 [Hibiscus syriacus]|uniref:RNase H type-1 domain-containing protein n=1 Tax=Hibiscus syriacus TaxID=106335 RepID=A0A6A2YCT4_HIBSY|nr:hypothetical protein F3Y22_tig00112226pilonHSYRG00037 [Hibiscus syriacus]
MLEGPMIAEQEKARFRWMKPAQSWVKANADGAMGGAFGMATAGGVLRDHHGTWIRGFSRIIGICCALKAELWALHDILVMAWNMGFRRVEVETDCMTAVKLINDRSCGRDGCTIVRMIKDVLAREWEIVVKFSHRETNMVADGLRVLQLERWFMTSLLLKW